MITNDLYPGDRIEIQVTHEILINREKSWIKLGVTSVVQDDEDRNQAMRRISTIVADDVLKVIEQNVDKVLEYQGSR